MKRFIHILTNEASLEDINWKRLDGVIFLHSVVEWMNARPEERNADRSPQALIYEFILFTLEPSEYVSVEQEVRSQLESLDLDENLRTEKGFLHFPKGTAESRIIDWFETTFETDF